MHADSRAFQQEIDRITRHFASLLYEQYWGVPLPTMGGTFYYCPWEERPRPGTVISCGVKKPGWATGTRFRQEAAYRRHYRRFHQTTDQQQ